MKQELKEIEDRILHRLSSSEGSPVDDVDLIATLEASKIKSQEIKVNIQLILCNSDSYFGRITNLSPFPFAFHKNHPANFFKK